MEATDGVLDMLPESMTYFDHVAFTLWIKNYMPDIGERLQAARLNITRRHLRMLKAGAVTPSLETYCRMCAGAGAPFGAWVRRRAL